MRLIPEQVQTVLQTISEHAGRSASACLFGSRLDDQARGGDVDLFVETASPLTLLERARLRLDLENRLGLPVDLLVHRRGTPISPFQQIARSRSMPLRVPG